MKETTTATRSDEQEQVGAQWEDKFGRVRTPRAYREHGDGTMVSGPEAIAAMSAEIGEHQVKRQAALRKMPAKVRRDYATYLRTGRLPEVRARAPREARNDRPRGSRRGERTTSASRDGPGDDGDSSEPPPAGRRSCACGCGADISHRVAKARYLNDTHAARDRQRRKRSRVAGPLDRHRRDPYLKFDDKPFEKLRERVEEGCRCNGQHVLDPDDGHCIKCGHRRGGSTPFAGFISARPAEARRARPVAA